jgi:hypothetical protein
MARWHWNILNANFAGALGNGAGEIVLVAIEWSIQ